MLTENDVVAALVVYLPKKGYVVENCCDTKQTGVDVVARHSATGRKLRVEAKGGTSSKDHTARFGLPFSPGQVLSHVSRAFYEVAAMSVRFPDDEVALALPDDAQHIARIECIGRALTTLGVVVYLVADDQSVRRWR